MQAMFPQMIDLRSDTVTRPSPGMLDAMLNAAVGDDVFEEDPTVKELENKVARIFGKEAGLFCPSGTMTNQIGIKILSSHGEELICEETSHVFLYEGGGLAFNSGLSVKLIKGDRGRLTAQQVEESVRQDNVHYPVTTVVSLENTHNRGGGSIYDLDEISKINVVCKKHNIRMHLDGARVFNALTEADYDAAAIGNYFDTISVCLSKGLGAPVGSVLTGSAELIRKARRVRKVLGGGMRQTGYLAAAGVYALTNNVSNLKEDHRRARVLGTALEKSASVKSVLPVDTNIVVSVLHESIDMQKYLSDLESRNIRAVPFGPAQVRMVTHLDFTDDMLDYACGEFKKI